MRTKILIAGIAASIVLVFVVSVATATPIALVPTPLTVAIYLVVGIAVPQYLVSK